MLLFFKILDLDKSVFFIKQTCLKEEVTGYGDIFSPDIRGQIIELNEKLQNVTPIDI
jgi:hypothetical protein